MSVYELLIQVEHLSTEIIYRQDKIEFNDYVPWRLSAWSDETLPSSTVHVILDKLFSSLRAISSFIKGEYCDITYITVTVKIIWQIYICIYTHKP